MERKTARGVKPKNMPVGNLITLGNKCAGRSEGEKSVPYPIGKSGGNVSDRGRDVAGPSSLHSKKPIKPGGYIMGLPGRSGALAKAAPGDIVSVTSEEWENVAEEVDGSELSLFVDVAETEEDYERTEALLCGAIKMLKASRAKPDVPHCFHLMVLAKLKPSMFSRSMLVTDALCSLLRRDHSMAFKTKSNPSVAVMAASILLIAYQEERCWPEQFIRVFIDDSLGERVWVDMAECKGFVDNIVTAFKTRLPPKSFLFPDMAMSSRPDCPSPPISTCSGGGESGDGDSEMSLECKESLDVVVCNRYSTMTHRVEELVMETVHNQFSLRHQNVDSVARNFIRFLSSVTGIMEVRRIVSTKLESWLQSPKLQRPATELLMSLCMNCNTHSATDVETIGHIIRFRIKHKPLLNQYMACLKELLAAHPDNIKTAIKNTIYNELSNARNPSNMPILAVIFQFAPEHSAITLAEEFLELFCNKEDFHRALRILFREIVRGLRHDMLFQKFCHGLMSSETKDAVRENPEICERMYYGVTDLIVMVMFVAISPSVRESATLMFRGEHRDLEPVRRYQDLVASIQQDAMYWMHKTVPKMYGPSKDDYVRALHKLLMMDPPDTYAVKDNYPAENDRPLYVKLASEVPLKQETLMRLLMIAVTKDRWVKPQDLIELVDKLIKRATLLHMEDVEVLHIDDTKIIDLIFNLSLYIPPENAHFPHGYRPPKMAITTSYWKAWIMLLLVTAHNPGAFGQLAWESYPTLRMLMEMCITNSFVFPLPTLLGMGEKAEDVINQEHLLVAKDKDVILELEEYLAGKNITEQNSLLVSQTMSMDYHGPARKPPPAVMEQLKNLNSTHRIGHLLCRSRSPDFLLDIITRQGTSQSMPWLAELVQSHENAFSMLPVQCLCEFLLSESGGHGVGDSLKHQQLVRHLRALLRAPPQAETSCSSLEILEYFLRRLSSQQAGARQQAVRGLQRLLHPPAAGAEAETDLSDHTWLLKHLKDLPGFQQVRSMTNQALRAAMQVETEPSTVSAYLRFLATHTKDDSVQEQSGLVSDLAQVIVERCMICSAILPLPDRTSHFVHASSTLNAFFVIFVNYMRAVKVPGSRETFSWADSQDQVRVLWANGEQAILHILVIHAIVILLTFGPSACSEDLFQELMAVWFPDQVPQAFLVDTSEEALLFPDWLKLRMIRSSVPRLVDAAVKDLEPSQLVLFIQSFGIPVSSMSRLLAALDHAVSTNLAALQDAVLDKSHKAYMAQLLEVQHSRGAVGGSAFAEVLGGTRPEDLPRGGGRPRSAPLLGPVTVYPVQTADISVGEVRSFLLQCFTLDTIHQHHRPSISETMRALQRHISRELRTALPAGPAHGGVASDAADLRPYITELFDAFTHCLQHRSSSSVFLEGLHNHYDLSAPLFRLLLHLPRSKDPLHLRPCLTIVSAILRLDHTRHHASSPLTAVLKMFPLADIQQYEPRSSSFSIANLATSSTAPQSLPSVKGASTCGAVKSGKFGDLYARCDINNEEDVLCSLMSVPAHALEGHIRALVEIAVSRGKLSVVRACLSRLLLLSANVTKTETKMPRRSIALLLDWLQVIDPELQESPSQLRKMLLFAKYRDQPQGIGLGGYSQAYLLGAFTQQANWRTLENTVRELLSKYDPTLNSGGVLDFVWAVTRVPKLWQGRERRTPRHAEEPLLMRLSRSHLQTLALYIVGEKCEQLEKDPFTASTNPVGEKCENVVKDVHTPDRMPLLLQWYRDDDGLYSDLVAKLCKDATQSVDSPSRRANRTLLYQLYLRRPRVLNHMTADAKSALPAIAGKADEGESAADVAIHCLLTMICSPTPGREFRKKLHDLEAAIRTLASKHPLLVLRHCHLIYTGLGGLTHLNFVVLKGNNNFEVLQVVIGVLELLHPMLFSVHHNKSVTAILDCYLDIYNSHGSPLDLMSVTTRVIDLIHAWLATDRPRALMYLVPKTDLLKSLSQETKEWRSLAVAAASAPTMPVELPLEDPTVHAPPLLPPNTAWLHGEAEAIATKLTKAQPGEDQLKTWRQLNALSTRAPTVLLVRRFLNYFCSGIHNSEHEIRSIAWDLISRVLLHDPLLAPQFVPAVLHALQHVDSCVVKSACDHLPNVILTLHEFAPDVLTTAFVCITSRLPSSLSSLTKSLSLLTLHTGA